MNKFTIDYLKKNMNILGTHNVSGNGIYDHLRITAISNKKYENAAKNLLFFPITLSEQMLYDGWIINPVDLRVFINDIIRKNPEYTYVVESSMLPDIENQNAKLIVVDNIMNSIESLYKSIINNRCAKTIAVTGSVGKTTTAGLIEKVIKDDYKTLRIYSKRITPLILQSFIINLLDETYEYIVIEIALYYKNHVAELTEMLRPSISAIINIDDCHIGIDGIKDKEDLYRSKAEIYRYSDIALYNENDPVINQLKDSKNSKLFKIGNEISFDKDKFKIGDLNITPFALTKLSLVQYNLALHIAMIVGLTTGKTVKKLNEYQPVEDRLNTHQIYGKDVIFDGDITNAGRIKHLSSHFYNSSVLILRKIGSSETEIDMTQILLHLNKFSTVYVFEDVEYLEFFEGLPNVQIVYNHDFLEYTDGMIFYHYSGYFRTYSTVKEDNLENLDNDLYKVYRIK